MYLADSFEVLRLYLEILYSVFSLASLMRLFSLSLLLSAWCFCASMAVSQPHLLPYVGYTLSAGYDDGASFLVGETDQLGVEGGIALGVGADFALPWERLPFVLSIRPSVETTFVPGETVTFENGESVAFSQRFWQASATLVGEVPVGEAPVVPFLGFGFTYARYTADFDTSEGASVVGSSEVSAWGLAPNLIAGVRLGRSRVVPLVEARYRFATPSPDFSVDRPGADIDNGFSVVAGARIML